MLGEFEYLVISAAARCGENAYGAAIREQIERAGKRSCSIGALYTTGWAKPRPSAVDGRSGWSVSPGRASAKRRPSISP